jgi:hypothetical protein
VTWAVASALGASCAGLVLLKVSMPGQTVTGGVGTGTIINMLPAISSLCLVASPAVLVRANERWRTWNRFDVALGGALGCAVVAFLGMLWVRAGSPTALLDNLSSQYGVPSSWYIIGGRPLVFDNPAWFALNLLALAATVVTSGVVMGDVGRYVRTCWQKPRTCLDEFGRPAGTLILFVAITIAGLTVYSIKSAVFDRYLWPLVPATAILMMYRPDLDAASRSWMWRLRLTRLSSFLCWTILLGVSLLYMLNSFAFDVARWQGGERLAALGTRAETIDAGYEWVGEHQPSLPPPNPPSGTEVFYERWWPSRITCGIVSGSPLPDARPTDAVPWRLFLIGGPEEKLYLFRRADPGCD